MKCTQTPGCTGTYDHEGWCSSCGMKMQEGTTALTPPRPSVSAVPSHEPPSISTDSRVGASPTQGYGPSTHASGAHGAGLVTLPKIEPLDPASLIMPNPEVAEGHRFCANPECGQPVGRQRGDEPPRAQGFCTKCQHPFSFVPRLNPGDVVGGQYEVVGCLAHGGLGWIYLAKDRNVHNVWRVLKGLLYQGDQQAIQNALDELRFLASVNHPNIVNIINFVEHQGDGYIVMEYVDGKSLRQILQERRAGNGGQPDPLPVTHAIAYMLEILPALGYLHERGLLFCDFKPDNVMRTAQSVKLIDLGAVYRMDDTSSPVYGTPGYQAPEIAETGPTVTSDLYTVARTLAVLCTTFPGAQHAHRYSLPAPHDVPLFAAHDALYQLLRRATQADPSARFQTAAEMGEQLTGVLREIVAVETGIPTPGPSANFTGKVRGRLDGPDWRALPIPLVGLDDPAAGYLATVAATDTDQLIDALQRAPDHTIEVDLQLVRALLDADRHDDAGAVLAAIDASGTRDWRRYWYRGLHELASENPAAATESFAVVYRHLPGELAPKLATAVGLELARNQAGAIPWYSTVARTDPSFTAAAFGLARCHTVLGNSEGAIDAYDRVPEQSSAHITAQIAKARVLLESEPDIAAIQDAARIVGDLALEPFQRAALTAEVLEAALPIVNTQPDPASPASALDVELSETGVRLGLERTYRELARRTGSSAERIDLVDRANQVRPRTLV